MVIPAMSPTEVRFDQLVPDHMSRVQIGAILFCFILNMIDGADVLIVSYAAPRLIREFHITGQQLGLVFSAGLAGMAMGALALAPISDRVGRRTMTLAALAIIAGGTIASSQASSLPMLMSLRLLVGLGIGSMLASMTSLAAEFAPPKYRSFAVTFATAGYPLGAVLAGAWSAWILQFWGWSGLFLSVGLFALGMLPLLAFALPESISFLIERQPPRALDRINLLRSRMGLDAMLALPIPQISVKIGARRLLDPEYRRSTLMIWACFFATFLTLYFLTSWIPKIAVDAGLVEGEAVFAGAAFNLGAFIGVICLGWLTSRVSLTRTIAVFFAGAPLAMLLFAFAHGSRDAVLCEAFLMGALVQGGFSGLYAVAARAYPAIIRTTGVGWGLGAGRLGAVLGPYLGGIAIGAGLRLETTMSLFAIPIAIAGVVAWRMGDTVGPLTVTP